MTCESIVHRASDFIDGMLPEPERAAVEEHLETCDACACYMSQLRATVNLLAKRHGPQLLDLARSLNEEGAEDLVQATWERALLEGPGELSAQRLVHLLMEEAERGETSIPAGEGRLADLDPDADTAELFYPHFYGEGPDIGSWVEPPRSWPTEAGVLSPEDDLTTAELYDVVDAALDEVGGDGARLVELVDIGGLDSGRAAAHLGVEESAARRSLHAARNHVRAALDNYYLETSRA